MELNVLKRKMMVSIGVASCIFCLSGVASYANDTSFTDIPKDYWAYPDIQWAVDHQVVNGYPDGTFKPNRSVSQSEWFAMLIRAYHPADLSDNLNSSQWDASYQDYAAKLGWTLTVPDRNVLKRGDIAVYLAEASGKHYDSDDAIQYILDIGLSEGKSSKSIIGFGKNDVVTRSEAITFIKRFKQAFPQLSPAPAGVEPYNRKNDLNRYENTTLHFSLQLPDSWKGKYEVTEQKDADSHILTISFISKINKPWGGIIFSISAWPKATWDSQGDDLIGNTHATKLSEQDNYVFVLSTPTDVEYDINNDSAKAEALAMYKDVKQILGTFTLTKAP